MTKLRHYDGTGTARFVTFSTYRRCPCLAEPAVARLFMTHLDALRAENGIEILGHVVMPDHVHLVLFPPDDVRLGVVIGQFKARTAHDILGMWERSGIPTPPALCVAGPGERQHRLWQRRCYDHNCRSATSVREKIEYCHCNPVKSGLVSDPEEWEWSSYRWYQGRRDVPLTVDSILPP